MPSTFNSLIKVCYNTFPTNISQEIPASKKKQLKLKKGTLSISIWGITKQWEHLFAIFVNPISHKSAELSITNTKGLILTLITLIHARENTGLKSTSGQTFEPHWWSTGNIWSQIQFLFNASPFYQPQGGWTGITEQDLSQNIFSPDWHSNTFTQNWAFFPGDRQRSLLLYRKNKISKWAKEKFNYYLKQVSHGKPPLLRSC